MGRSDGFAALVRQRAAAFDRFAQWEAEHPTSLSAAVAIEAIGTLYDLMPPSARQRPVDVSGVARFHDMLRRLPR